jgi:molecular chaperone GrpE (heat shock protein)
MSDDPQEDQVPDEEGTPAEEAVSEEESEDKPAAPKAEDADANADADDEPFSVENLRAEIDELGSRAKSAGLKPFRNMVRAYLDQTLDAVDGLLSALEGNKRKKGN